MRDSVYLFRLIIAVQTGIQVWWHTDVVHIIDLSACLCHILPHTHCKQKQWNQSKWFIYLLSLKENDYEEKCWWICLAENNKLLWWNCQTLNLHSHGCVKLMRAGRTGLIYINCCLTLTNIKWGKKSEILIHGPFPSFFMVFQQYFMVFIGWWSLHSNKYKT